MTHTLLCYKVLRVVRHPSCHGEDLPQPVDLPRDHHRDEDILDNVPNHQYKGPLHEVMQINYSKRFTHMGATAMPKEMSYTEYEMSYDEAEPSH
jgi:hypothetical protein